MDNNQPNNYTSPTPSPQINNPSPIGGQPSDNKKKTKLIVGLITASILIIAGAVAAFILMSSDNNNDTGSNLQKEEVPEAVRIENSRTASAVAEFNTVCDVGSITNAAEFDKPYRIAAFYQASSDRAWTPITLDASSTYATNEASSVNVIACLSEVEGSAAKSIVCEFRSGGQAIAVDYYSLDYDLTIHEAKSGKRIDSLGKIRGTTGDDCPTEVSFSPENPKIYAAPNGPEVNAALAKFAESN